MKLLRLFIVLFVSFQGYAQQNIPKVPALNIPQNLNDWIRQRESISKILNQQLGSIPIRKGIPQVKILSTTNKNSYLLYKFEFDNGAGAIVPGYFLVPNDGRSKHPAIYYCHWHGGNYDLGKEEIFTTHHTPQVPAETLVNAGYVVMAIDAYCFGERSGQGPGGKSEKGSDEELSTSKRELWLGRSLWAMIIRDDLMALDYLFSRPEVDTKNVGVTGISMGATRSWWLMALDERIKTGVAVACLTRYQNLLEEQKLKYHGIYYYVPGILTHFDSEAIVSLIAPRPILFMTGDQDMGSPVTGIMKIESEVKKVYKLYESENNFRNMIYPNVGHEYTTDMWRNMLDWMKANLQ